VADLRELYQSVILDHSRSPRNFGPLPDASAEGSGHNPMCGDAVTVWIRMDGDTIADIHFATPPGVGCAISKASASIMTTAVRGKTRQEAEALFERFHALVTGNQVRSASREPGIGSRESGVGSHARNEAGTEEANTGAASNPLNKSLPLGSLAAFGGVSQFPIRVKCATLAWHALRSALGTS
jgi:nitrogen fixation protein NifU and related proteins